jgi:hypothetical protein
MKWTTHVKTIKHLLFICIVVATASIPVLVLVPAVEQGIRDEKYEKSSAGRLHFLNKSIQTRLSIVDQIGILLEGDFFQAPASA